MEVIPVINTEGYGDFPGPEVLALAGTKNPAELKDYIDTLYREEYYKGRYEGGYRGPGARLHEIPR